MVEVWKNIKGFEGKYQISNTGKVASLKYNNTNERRLLKLQLNKKKGIYQVNLWKNNKAYRYDVVFLVAGHFLIKQNEDDVVVHIGKKDDDNVYNLKYVSRSEAYYKEDIKKPESVENIYTKGEIKEHLKKCKKNNIKPHQFYKRLYEGWTADDAVEIPIKRKQRLLKVKLYEYNGKLYSVKQLSQISNGISQSVIYKRLARKWTVEECVEIPLSKNKKWR